MWNRLGSRAPISAMDELFLVCSPQPRYCLPDRRGLFRFRVCLKVRLKIACRRLILPAGFVDARSLKVNLRDLLVAQIPCSGQFLFSIREVSIPLGGVFLSTPDFHKRESSQEMRCRVGGAQTRGLLKAIFSNG